MSQPHPPRPEDQPAQQPRDQQDPPTQSIPAVPPGTEPTWPAFMSDTGEQDTGADSWDGAGTPGPDTGADTGAAPAAAPAPGPAPGPTPAPPPPVPPQPVLSPPGPADHVWPQPGTARPTPGPAAEGWAGQPTGPVDFVPGFAGPAGPAAPSGATAPPTPRGRGPRWRLPHGLTSADRGAAVAGAPVPAIAALVLGVAGLAALEIGLILNFGNDSLWSVVTAWSAFATAAALVGLTPLVLRWLPAGPPAGQAWRIGAAGVAGLVAFWVLVALPLVASDRGFLLTAGPALAAAALWLAPGRTPAEPGSPR